MAATKIVDAELDTKFAGPICPYCEQELRIIKRRVLDEGYGPIAMFSCGVCDKLLSVESTPNN